MHTLKYTFISLLGILLFAWVTGFFLPSQYQLERLIIISAPSNVIFNEVNTLKNWQHWSPWRDIDPKVTLDYEGPASGVGARMLWASDNPKLGTGSQEIITSIPNEYIAARLVFKNSHGSSSANWHFKEQTDGTTQVRWMHHSDVGNNIFAKYMSIIMIKPMLAKDYEKGLKQLKIYVEQNCQ